MLLGVLLPLASVFPDGLEKVAEILGVQESIPLLNSIFSDYSVSFIENSYLSTLIAGLIGFFAVFAVTWAMGKALKRRKTRNEATGNMS